MYCYVCGCVGSQTLPSKLGGPGNKASVGGTCSQSLTVLMGDISTLKQLPAGPLTSCHCFVQLYPTAFFPQNFYNLVDQKYLPKKILLLV